MVKYCKESYDFLSNQTQPFVDVLQVGVLRNFAIFTGKRPCWSLLLIKLQVWRHAALLKRDSNTVVSLWILQNFLKHIFFTKHLRWLLLLLTKRFFADENEGQFVEKLLKNVNGQVDSPESPETTELTENFAKVTKYLAKLKNQQSSRINEHINRQIDKYDNIREKNV